MNAARFSWAKSGNALALAGLVAVVGNNVATALPAVELSAVASGTGGFMILDSTTGNFTGLAASGGGDVNGDGIDDLILGAPGDDTTASNSGAAFVVFGKTSGATEVIGNLESTGRGFAILGGPYANAGYGYAVSMAGDVNGDGLCDLLVSAPALDFGGNIGYSYLVFGKTSSTPVSLLNVFNGTGGFGILTTGASNAGSSLTGVGDVNGDGLSDIAVGAPGDDFDNGFGVRLNSGMVYVIHGKTDSTLVPLTGIPAISNGFVIGGEAASDGIGRAVSGAGDVNGDGLMDIVIGLGTKDVVAGTDAGRTYVVFGTTTGGGGATVDLTRINAGTGGFAIDGEQANSGSGYSVSGAGDANGDGFADLVVAAPGFDASGGRTNAGRVYTVFGKSTGGKVLLSEIGGAVGFAITGETGSDAIGSGYAGLGSGVSAAGDVNGDGRGDIVIGAYNADAGGGFKGRTYVVFGKITGTAIELSGLTAGTEGFVINNPPFANGAGVSVCAAGDVDRDGLADLLVTNPFALGGAAYVVHSPLTPPAFSVTQPVSIRDGDTPRIGVGTHRFGNDPTVHSSTRLWIDYSNGNGPGPYALRADTRTYYRQDKSDISNLLTPGALINANWGGDFDRSNWTTARLTLRIDPAQLVNLVGSDLRIYQSSFSNLDGPWTEMANPVYDAARGEITADLANVTPFGPTYYFAVGQKGPINDNFANALPIGLSPLQGVTTYATREAGEPNHFNGDGGVSGSLWYTFTPTTTGEVTFETCGGVTDFDTIIAAYVGSPVNNLAEAASNDQSCGDQSSITFIAVAGEPYHIAVTGYQTSTGTFTLRRTESPAVGPTIVNIFQVVADPTCEQAPTWQVNFSEPIEPSSFTFDDLNVTNTVGSRFVTGATISPGPFPNIYFVQLVLSQGGGTGTLGFSIPVGAVQDLFGNSSTNSFSAAAYNVQPCPGGGGFAAGDIDKNGVVNVADVTLLSNFIVNGAPPLP